jgi:hypothetical protein
MDFNPQGALQPKIKPTDFEFGSMTGITNSLVLFIDGCLDYRPVFELQTGIYFDTYGCVSYSMANGFEILFNRLIELGKISESRLNWLKINGYLIDGKVRLSNRWLVVRSGTVPNVGNSGEKVADFARHNGLAPLTLCDWDLTNRDSKVNNLTAYYDASTIDKKADEVATEFAKIFDIQYEWVNSNDFQESSKYGAVQVYVKAWYKGADGKYYNPTPGTINHAIDLGQFSTLSVIDQYNPQIKQIEALKDFYYVGLKLNITEKLMTKPNLKNNTLVQLVSGDGSFGLFLDGRIIVDDTAKILASYLMRNNGKLEGTVAPLVQEQWDLFDKVNLKLEPIS